MEHVCDLRGEVFLAGVDPVQVGVLDVPGPVAPVLLPVLPDPLVCDLVEPVPVTSSLYS